MDNFTWICQAESCCPGLTRNFVGVASSHNFFWVRDFGQLEDSAATGCEIFL